LTIVPVFTCRFGGNPDGSAPLCHDKPRFYWAGSVAYI